MDDIAAAADGGSRKRKRSALEGYPTDLVVDVLKAVLPVASGEETQCEGLYDALDSGAEFIANEFEKELLAELDDEAAEDWRSATERWLEKDDNEEDVFYIDYDRPMPMLLLINKALSLSNKRMRSENSALRESMHSNEEQLADAAKVLYTHQVLQDQLDQAHRTIEELREQQQQQHASDNGSSSNNNNNNNNNDTLLMHDYIELSKTVRELNAESATARANEAAVARLRGELEDAKRRLRAANNENVQLRGQIHAKDADIVKSAAEIMSQYSAEREKGRFVMEWWADEIENNSDLSDAEKRKAAAERLRDSAANLFGD